MIDKYNIINNKYITFLNMSRTKPYTTNQETWNTILQKNLRIPMNQREYSWEYKQIIKFIEDIIKINEKGK